MVIRQTVAWLLLLAAPCAAWAQTPVDGVYSGAATIQGGAAGRSSGRCDAQISFKLRVANRTFTWKLPTSQAQVTIAADGTFKGTNGLRYINGTVQGTHLAAATTGRGCNYVWSLDRQ